MTETYACLILPFPGSVNHLWRCWKGRSILSAAGRRYQTDAAVALNLQTPLPRFATPVKLVASLGPPDSRRRDLDNHFKAASDALVKAGVLEDDSLIHDLRLRWDAKVKGCRVEIEPLAIKTDIPAGPLFSGEAA